VNLCNLRGPSLSALTLHPILLSNQGSVQQPSDHWRCLLTLYYCPRCQVPGSTCLMLHHVAHRHAAVVGGILHCSSCACPFRSALWCRTPSHRHFCTNEITWPEFSQFLIPLVKMLLFASRIKPSEGFSFDAKLSNFYFFSISELATFHIWTISRPITLYQSCTI